jgi:uncharacterized protein DUF4214
MTALAQNSIYIHRIPAILLLLIVTAVSGAAQCTFVNGDFETTTLNGWAIQNNTTFHANWYNYTGTTTPFTGHPISAPPAPGTQAAVTDQDGPATTVMFQDVVIPNTTFASLSFFLAYNNTNTTFVTLPTLAYTGNQQFRIDVITTTANIESVAAGDVLANLYQSKPGDPLVISPTLFTYDLSAFAGQTVRLRFAEAVGISFFLVAVDQVCLKSLAVTNTRTTPLSATPKVIDLGAVQVSYPSVTTAGNTVISQLDTSAQTAPPAGDIFIGPAFDVSRTAVHTAPATICLHPYGVTDPVAFAKLRLLHKEGGVWIDLPTSTVNYQAREVCGQVTTFSPFIVGQRSTPTASSPIISGRVIDATGTPLGGVEMQLSGAQNQRTITATDGSYSFSVDAGSFYSISPVLANYSFSPAERSLSPVGSVTDAMFTATVDASPQQNPLDTDMFFVRQQYLDFLGREPDTGGLNYWANRVADCGTDSTCLRQRRIDVSGAFFIESEFQNIGSFVYRLYDAGLGRRLTYPEFASDRAQVVAGANLEAARAALANSFVARSEFQQRYVSATSADAFVDSLLSTIQSQDAVDLSAQRQTLIGSYNSGGDMNQSRSLVLQTVVDLAAVKQATYNPSFVAMEYFGYLQRNPDENGYQFWLNVLNHDPSNFRGMVCSFLTSTEYQRRFATAITHSNSECGPALP